MTTENTGAPAAAAPGATATPAAAAPGETVEVRTGGFSPDQLRQMAQWQVERGTLTREQADAMLQADGVQKNEAAPSPVDAYLQSIGSPAARPEEYKLPTMAGPDQPFTPELQQVDKAARGWLAEAKLPKETGNYIAAEVDRTAQAWERMNDGERQIWEKTQIVKLERLWGGEYQKRVDMARALVREVEKRQPGILAMLDATGAGSSATVIAQLWMQAAKLAERPQGKQ